MDSFSVVSETIRIFNINITEQMIFPVIGTIIIISVYSFYSKIARYPRGPYPLPLFGNLLYFIGWSILTGRSPHFKIKDLRKKYGPVFTIWTFNRPFVFLMDPKIHKDAFQKADISDRGFKHVGLALSGGRGWGIIFQEFNRTWQEKIKLINESLRKFLMTETLGELLNRSTAEEFNEMLTNEGIDKPIEIRKYIHFIVNSVILESMFGKRYIKEDPETKQLIQLMKKVESSTNFLALLDFLPPFMSSFIFWTISKVPGFLGGLIEIRKAVEKKYDEHLDTYKPDQIRDIVDAFIAMKEEAILEDKESAVHLTDVNLVNILTDLLIVATDTTSCMLEWVLAFIVTDGQALQSTIRLEIKKNLKNRFPAKNDKDVCPQTMAFITESLRMRTPIPPAVIHESRAAVSVGGYEFPAKTKFISHLHGIHMNDDYWPNPDQFDASRFLNQDGTFQSNKQLGFVSFGVGRRSCPGDKLAYIDGFIVLARIMQLTEEKGLKLAFYDELTDLEPDPTNLIFFMPKRLTLRLVNAVKQSKA